MTNPAETLQPLNGGKAEGGGFMPVGADRQSALQYLLVVLHRAGPQKRLIAGFILLYLVTSFVQMAGLFCLNAGLSVAGVQKASKKPQVMVETPATSPADGGIGGMADPNSSAGGAGPGKGMQMASEALEWLSVPKHYWWMIFFGGFLSLTIAGAGIDHVGQLVRARLMSTYEASQMSRGLKVLCSVDPRDLANASPREMRFALRSDCRSMRMVFQIVLLITIALVQISFPLAYILKLNANLTLLGMAPLLLGFYPIYLLGKKAGRMTFSRQEISVDAGVKVSTMINSVQTGELTEADKVAAVADIHSSVKGHHKLWRQQNRIRSLCGKIPTWFSLLGTFFVLMYGMHLINKGSMNLKDLLTFIVAIRVVYAPFSSIGNRFSKLFENLLTAARHLEFIRRFSLLAKQHGARTALAVDAAGKVHIQAVQAKNLVLAPGEGVTAGAIDLNLAPGSVLAIVDPAINLKNPLAQMFTGSKYVAGGDLCLNGMALNDIPYDSIRKTYCFLRPSPCALSGTLLECVRQLLPDMTEAEARDLCQAVIGPETLAAMPQGLDTPVSPEIRKKGLAHPTCFILLDLLAKLADSRPILIIDAYAKSSDTVKLMLRRLLGRLGSGHVVVWLDRSPPSDLPNQRVAVFQSGLFLGYGDLDWFGREFADWDSRLQMFMEDTSAEDEELALAEEGEEDAEEEG